VRFTTFAYPRIAGAIKDALRRLDPLSQEERQQVRRLQQTRAVVLQARGREPHRGARPAQTARLPGG
jgi:DNA-directed RNA polymerase specialized sigma subunit